MSSILLCAIAVSIAFVSNSIYGFIMLFAALIPILVCGLSISFMVFALSQQNNRFIFIKSLKYSFGISSLLVIIGYIIFCLTPIIFG